MFAGGSVFSESLMRRRLLWCCKGGRGSLRFRAFSFVSSWNLTWQFLSENSTRWRFWSGSWSPCEVLKDVNSLWLVRYRQNRLEDWSWDVLNQHWHYEKLGIRSKHAPECSAIFLNFGNSPEPLRCANLPRSRTLSAVATKFRPVKHHRLWATNWCLL